MKSKSHILIIYIFLFFPCLSLSLFLSAASLYSLHLSEGVRKYLAIESYSRCVPTTWPTFIVFFFVSPTPFSVPRFSLTRPGIEPHQVATPRAGAMRQGRLWKVNRQLPKRVWHTTWDGHDWACWWHWAGSDSLALQYLHTHAYIYKYTHTCITAHT